MAYTVLARRYRSGTFDDVVGQEHVAQTLKKAITSDRVAHAYLFNGTRGVGKTSMARILAKALNCQSFDKPTPQPCGKCVSCLAIARGDDMDVIEIDAASNTQVEKTREVVIENAAYRPAHSRFKIYIIDEVHMLSKSSFNALLKTLEEPPSHVKFILATTEPEKIPNTILSRCQRYDFRNIPTREIAAHLKSICKLEKIKADDDALLLVAKAGAGSMRDALSLLDRLLSVGEKQLTAEMIEQLLGLPKTQLLFDLAQSIGEGDVKSTLGRANSMVQSGMSVDSLIAALVEHLRNLLILRTCGPDSDIVEVPGLPPKDLEDQAERFDAVVLTQDITILEELRRQVRQSQAGRALLDATLVRLALADQFASVGDLMARLGGGGASTGGAARPATPRRAATAAPQKKNSSEPVKRAETAGHAPQLATPPREPVARPETPARAIASPIAKVAIAPTPAIAPAEPEDDDDLPQPGRVWEAPTVSLTQLLKQHEQSSSAASAAAPPVSAPAESAPASTDSAAVVSLNTGDLEVVWKSLLEAIAAQGPALQGVLSLGKLIDIADGQAVIRYSAKHESLVRMFDRNGKKEQVRDAISKVLNRSVGVRFDVEPAEEVPAAPPVTDRAATGAPTAERPGPPERQARNPEPPPPPAAPAVRITPEMVQNLRDKQPLVKALMDALGAQIIKVE